MSPAGVNDSGRAMMAAVAKYRDDIAGAIVTGGTSTAYTISSYQQFDSLAHLDGKVIAFTPHVTNGANGSSLNVDGLGVKPILTAPGAGLPGGVLIQGTPYVALYSNTDGAFYVQGFYGNPYNMPIGGMIDFIGPTAPNSSFVLPFGQAVSRTTYATLFGMVGTAYGPGDGSTTFSLPDLRGRVIAGAGAMGGADAGRLTTANFGANPTVAGNVGGLETHTLTTAEIPAHSHGVTDPGHSHGFSGGVSSVWGNPASGSSSPGGGVFNMLAVSITGSATGISIQNNGGGSPHAIVQPTMVLNKILRII